MDDARRPGGGSDLPPAIVHPGVPRPRARRIGTGGLGSRATLVVMAGALILGAGAWAATRSGGRDGLPLPGMKKRDVTYELINRRVAALADELCACPDPACGDRVTAELDGIRVPHGTPGPEDRREAAELARKVADCRQRLGARAAP